MNARKLLEYAVIGLLILVAGSLVLGQLLGQPLVLSYVETGSMAPTLHPGDGFIAIPPAIAGPIETGDVVTFDAENLHGGGLVTHRVVDTTEAGFITRGDANPVTDQDGAEPPVEQSQIVAEALQIGGQVVVIPQLGRAVIVVNNVLGFVQQQLAAVLNTRAVLGAQGLAFLMFGFGIATYLVSELFGGGTGRQRERSVSDRARRQGIGGVAIVAILSIVLLIFLTASMTVPAGTQEFEIISSSQDSPGIGVIQAGTSETVRYQIPSNGLLPVMVFLEPASEGITVEPTDIYVPPNGVRESIVELSAPASTGYYTRALVEHRYLALLPIPAIEALYEIHAWLPIIVIDLILVGGFAAIGLALVTGSRRVRERDGATGDSLWRWLR